MDLKDKLMCDIGFLDVLIKHTEWLISDSHQIRLKILREHIIVDAHKKLKEAT